MAEGLLGGDIGYAYYHPDHLGSSNVITDKNGKQVASYEYTPYGSIARNEGTDAVKHKFTGKELDSTTGLYFYGARYYDPEIGRFISADPTIQRPFDPQDLNRYAYCRNNPINYTDPTGLGWKSFWKKFGSSVLQIAGIIAAPFTGGASLYLTYAAMAWSGVQAAQAGQFAAWAAGFAVSLALGGLYTPNFSNLGLQIGVGALQGAAIGAISGGVASMVGGGSFGEGAAYGAMGGAGGGAVSAFVQSQQFQNSSEGYGFKSNNDVIDALGKEGRFQEAIDFATNRYGLGEGSKYDPTLPSGTRGLTDMGGNVKMGPDAFSQKSLLQGTIAHEQVHRSDVLAGVPKIDNRGRLTNRGYMEGRAYAHTIKNAKQLDLTPNVVNYYKQRYYDYTGQHFK